MRRISQLSTVASGHRLLSHSTQNGSMSLKYIYFFLRGWGEPGVNTAIMINSKIISANGSLTHAGSEATAQSISDLPA